MKSYPLNAARAWKLAPPVVLTSLSLLLAGCGTIRVPLPAQPLSFADPNSPIVITASLDGSVSGSAAGQPVSFEGLPPVGTGEVAGGTWGITAEVMAGATANLYGSLAQHQVSLEDFAVKVAFYRAGTTEPECNASGFVQAAAGISVSGTVTLSGGKYVVSSGEQALSGADRTRLTTALQQFVQKAREGGWLVKACASGRLAVDGSAPPPGTTIRVTGLDARLQLNGVL